MSEEFECEECGRSFDSERGLHVHQSQKHPEDEATSQQRDTERSDGIKLTTKQFGSLTFTFGLLLGFILGGLVLGGSLTDTGDGSPASNVVELSSTEYPYGDLEAGVGEGERTFGNMTFNLEGEPYIGSTDAEVTAVSYEDFECPFCSQYNQNAYPQIVDNYVRNGDVQYFYKNLPLSRIHPWAEASALASECALNQDSEVFWTFKKGFFDNQEKLGNAYKKGNFDESMYRWAEQTGLDTEQFKQCYDNKEEMDEVNQDKAEAGENGAQATPTIFINNEIVEGAQPYSRFEAMIESALQ